MQCNTIYGIEMKRIIDKSTWKRKEHFDFFNGIEDPTFGLVVDFDMTKAYKKCKNLNWSFHKYYHFLSTKAANEIEEFRTRIEDGKVVVYDKIHSSTTILKDDKTFAFTFVAMTETFEEFSKLSEVEFERARKSIGLGMTAETEAPNMIHYSTIPWVNFRGLKHPISTSFADSTPKISFGKLEKHTEDKLTMAVGIYGHHGLMDGYHVGLFVERFQQLLND